MKRNVELRDFLDSNSSNEANNSRKPVLGSINSWRKKPPQHIKIIKA